MNLNNITIELKWLEGERCSIRRKPRAGMIMWVFFFCFVLFIKTFSCPFRRLLDSLHALNKMPGRQKQLQRSCCGFRCSVGGEKQQKHIREKEKWPWAVIWKRSSKTRKDVSEGHGHLGGDGRLIIDLSSQASVTETNGGEPLKVIITTERMSAGRLGSNVCSWP